MDFVQACGRYGLSAMAMNSHSVILHRSAFRLGPEESSNFPSVRFIDIVKDMAEQEKNDIAKRRGRPATGLGIGVLVRLQPDLLAWVDAERAKLEPEPSRPEFIRQIIDAKRGR